MKRCLLVFSAGQCFKHSAYHFRHLGLGLLAHPMHLYFQLVLLKLNAVPPHLDALIGFEFSHINFLSLELYALVGFNFVLDLMLFIYSQFVHLTPSLGNFPV